MVFRRTQVLDRDERSLGSLSGIEVGLHIQTAAGGCCKFTRQVDFVQGDGHAAK